MAMLSPTLTNLVLSFMPSLVELPSSFQNLNQLENLWITNCRNLVTLPTRINLKSLNTLYLTGCSRLRSFPEISTNISCLNLSKTGIEEVPSQIENFSNLSILSMRDCMRLKCVSLNISKLEHLEEVDFSNCGALTGVELSGDSSELAMEAKMFDFSDCFKLNQEALIQQQSISLNYMILPGDEVPSYFTHRTTGNSSLTIPLFHDPLSQPFLRYRVCAVVRASNSQFKGRFRNCFDSIDEPDFLMTTWKCRHLVIFDCCIPLKRYNASLAQLNYKYGTIKIQLGGRKSMSRIRGWGIRLLENFSSQENRLTYPNTLLHVCEADENNTVSDGCHEAEHGEECDDSDIGYETDQNEECGDSDDIDIGFETDQSEECGDSDDSDIGSLADQSEEWRQ